MSSPRRLAGRIIRPNRAFRHIADGLTGVAPLVRTEILPG
jgi:hypothetical protein